MNKTGLKRLKRKRKLVGRIRCHGDKSVCKHHRRKVPVALPKENHTISWWQKFIKVFKKVWK